MTRSVSVTFAGTGDAFGSGGRYQACIHLRWPGHPPILLDCGATSLSALRSCGLDPGEISAILVSHLHGDHFGGVPFLVLDGQFTRRSRPLTVAGPPGTGVRLAQAMETLFPGSSGSTRRFRVDVVELAPGSTATVAGAEVSSYQVDHASGAPSLGLRVAAGGKVLAYTGDTAWTDELVPLAAGADLLVAEAYFLDKVIPYHLSHADLVAHRTSLSSGRIILTHMSGDVLGRSGRLEFEAAHDGMVVEL